MDEKERAIEEREKEGFEGEVAVVAYGERLNVRLDRNGLASGELFIPAGDILVINRYLSAKVFPTDFLYSVVYKVSDTEVALYEFYRNPDAKDAAFDEKAERWAAGIAKTVEENDWNAFNPIRNGYLTYTFRDTHAQYRKETAEKNKTFAVGLAVAGGILAVVGAVFVGIGKVTFGATGIVLGVLSAACGVYSLISSKNKK